MHCDVLNVFGAYNCSLDQILSSPQNRKCDLYYSLACGHSYGRDRWELSSPGLMNTFCSISVAGSDFFAHRVSLPTVWQRLINIPDLHYSSFRLLAEVRLSFLGWPLNMVNSNVRIDLSCSSRFAAPTSPRPHHLLPHLH